MNLNFSKQQHTAITTALTLLAVLVIVAFVLALFTLSARFVSTFSGVLMPLVVAGVLALMLRPFFHWLTLDKKLHPALGLIVVFSAVLIPLTLFLWFFGSILVGQLVQLIHDLPETYQKLLASLEARMPQLEQLWVKYDLANRSKEVLQERAGFLMATLQSVLTSAVEAGTSIFRYVARLFNWAVMPVYLAFLLLGRKFPTENVGEYLPFLKPETRTDVVYLIDEFIKIIVTFFRGQIVIALGQGILFAIGFSMVGLKYGFVLGLLLGLLNIIPYLGSMIGLAITLPLAYFQTGGGPVTLLLVVIVIVVVGLIESYILTPRIMGKSTGLHPMVIMLALFFWGTAFGGIMGMILAIPLTAFLVVFWRLAKTKYIKEIL